MSWCWPKWWQQQPFKVIVMVVGWPLHPIRVLLLLSSAAASASAIVSTATVFKLERFIT